uniref:isoleucine--tRNA ligase n=1 Tax=Octactis speculum TaxID=3111310 RepID=A0A7S2AHV0_9STRA
MAPWFMESVWWVFKELFKKGLVYKGYKVMPYSTACGTPLSNFEANLNYKDVVDPSVVVSFPLESDPTVKLLAWTTTPWTLPSNVALCVSPAKKDKYIKIEDLKSGEKWILMEARLVQIYPQMGGKKWKKAKNAELFKVLDTFPGSKLVGLKYLPLFDYFTAEYGETAFRVLSDGYVTADGGTGIVHQAPAFGEDDYRVCIANGIIKKGGQLPCPVDVNGCYTDEVSEWKGMFVKDADDSICDALKAKGRLIAKIKFEHSYPFCWRSDTPLIYKAVASWFVSVESIKERLVANNKETYWVPDFVKVGRFHNWLQDARDWCISRNRFWGTPLPIWSSEDGEEIVAIGSIEELAELSGRSVDSIKDLHREFIDEIEIPSKQGKGVLKRVDEVFDCWFESGSMPYAQLHYPFENKERFEKGFPAHFIAEGLDQTRGWFYTLSVLSTALFDKPPFQNLIVNGMVLAEDGKKMSKRLQNYPDPNKVISSYGADALRMYMLASPVVRAEPLAFKESGVWGVNRDLYIPWYNAFRFLLQNAARWQRTTGRTFRPAPPAVCAASKNPLDLWIRSELQLLIKFLHEEMRCYRLYTVMKRLVAFLDDLTKWYVRLNRERLKGLEADDAEFTDTHMSLSVLYDVLLTVTSLFSPFSPYFSEFLYQRLRKLHPNFEKPGASQEELGSAASIHFAQLPNVDESSQLGEKVVLEMKAMIEVVELGRKAREAKNVSLKKPITELVVVTTDPIKIAGLAKLETYICSELNAFKVTVTTKEGDWCTFSAIPNFKELGKRCGPRMQEIKANILKLTPDDLASFKATGKCTLPGDFEVTSTDLTVKRSFAGDTEVYSHTESDDGSIVVAVNITENQQVIDNWLSREFVGRVQKLRKASGIDIADTIDVFYAEEGSGEVAVALDRMSVFIKQKLRCTPAPLALLPANPLLTPQESAKAHNSELTVAITWPLLVLSKPALAKSYPKVAPEIVELLLASLDREKCVAAGTKVLKFHVDGETLELVLETHWFLSANDFVASAQK